MLVAALVACLAGAAGYVELRPATYQATNTVVLSPAYAGAAPSSTPATAAGSAAPWPGPGAPASVATSIEVADLAAAQLHVADPASLLPEVSAGTGQSGGTDVLYVVATTGSAARSVAVANAFASAFERYTSAQERAEVATLQRTDASLAAEVTRLQQAERAGDPTAAAKLSYENSEVLATFGTLQQTELAAPYATPGTPARGAVAVALSKKRIALIALAVAIVAGLGIAFIRDHLDQRLRSGSEDEEDLSFPVLAELPPDPPTRQRGGVAVIARPRSGLAESVRELRAAIQFIAGQQALQVLVVTSPSPGDGKTTVAGNLAAALAGVGYDAILVGADMRRPSVEQLFTGMDEGPGLSEVLWVAARTTDPRHHVPIPTPSGPGGGGDAAAGPGLATNGSMPPPAARGVRAPGVLAASRGWRAAPPLAAEAAEELRSALRPTALPGLSVLPPGGSPSAAADLLSTTAMDAVLAALAGLADIVVLDTPPLLVAADPLVLAARADGVLLVLSEGSTERPDVAKATKRLASVGARVVGTVVNRVAEQPVRRSYGYR